MDEIDNNEVLRVRDMSRYKMFDIKGTLREFNDRFEYLIIEDYEWEENFFETHVVPVGDISVILVENVYDEPVTTVSIEFSKTTFSYVKVLSWLRENDVAIPKKVGTKKYVDNAAFILDGIKFKGVTIISYEKGKRTVPCLEDYPEITWHYQCDYVVNDSRQSKIVEFERTKSGKAVIIDENKPQHKLKLFYNGKEIETIPTITFDIDRDRVVSNGNVILCNYIGPYKNDLIGFYQIKSENIEENIPISYHIYEPKSKKRWKSRVYYILYLHNGRVDWPRAFFSTEHEIVLK